MGIDCRSRHIDETEPYEAEPAPDFIWQGQVNANREARHPGHYDLLETVVGSDTVSVSDRGI